MRELAQVRDQVHSAGPLDGPSELPLLLATHVGLAPGNDLASLRKEPDATGRKTKLVFRRDVSA